LIGKGDCDFVYHFAGHNPRQVVNPPQPWRSGQLGIRKSKVIVRQNPTARNQDRDVADHRSEASRPGATANNQRDLTL
jgi:hypothetical protein